MRSRGPARTASATPSSIPKRPAVCWWNCTSCKPGFPMGVRPGSKGRMLENIEIILRGQCGLDKSRPIVVGVSGGPDSLCLLEAMRQAGYPVLAAHFNHKPRPESDSEAKAVET